MLPARCSPSQVASIPFMAVISSPFVTVHPNEHANGHQQTHSHPDLMTSIMSYQYPPLPSNGAEMDTAHPGYVSTYSLPPQQPSNPGMVDLHKSQLSFRDRKEPEEFMKRSFSTPDALAQQANVSESQHQHQSQLSAMGEKRRNKLGYHRTSVACGHCRRRKIRCIPCTTDLQGRCINCIRLKKECSFYPVDQPPPSDPRHMAPSQSSGAPNTSSTSSSPAASIGHPAEMPRNSSYPPMSMAPLPSMAPPIMKSAGVEGIPLEVKAPLSSSTTRSYDFASQPAAGWMATESCPSPSSKPGDINATWRAYPSNSPMSNQFSPFSQAPPSSATWTSGSSESGSRDDMAWGNYPPPVRSMSYGGEPLMGSPHSNYHPVGKGRSFERRSSNLSDVYSSSAVGSSHLEPPTGSVANASGPLSAGAAPPPSYSAWPTPPQQHPQQPQPIQYTYQKPDDGYPNWSY